MRAVADVNVDRLSWQTEKDWYTEDTHIAHGGKAEKGVKTGKLGTAAQPEIIKKKQTGGSSRNTY